MKRIIYLLMICSILLICFSGYAVGGTEMSVSSAVGSTGETVKIDVSISNNPGIASYKLKLNFDKAKLEPISISGNGITSNIQQSGIDKNSLDFITAVWSNESDSKQNGVLFSVYFKIKQTSEGITPLSLSYTKGDICNQNLEDVDPLATNGSITIKSNTNDKWSIDGYDGNAVTVTAPSNVSGGERIYIAKYSRDGILIDCEIIKANAQAGKSATVQCSKNIMPQSGETVRIMLWNEKFVPLTAPMTKR